MAGSKTAYLAEKLLNHVLGLDLYFAPAALYVALSMSPFDPLATGEAMDEVVAGDYLRLGFDNNSDMWGAASTGVSPSQKSNVAAISFDAATESWGTPMSVYLADATSGGNLLYGCDINSPEAIDTGDVVKIPASAFVFEDK